MIDANIERTAQNLKGDFVFAIFGFSCGTIPRNNNNIKCFLRQASSEFYALARAELAIAGLGPSDQLKPGSVEIFSIYHPVVQEIVLAAATKYSFTANTDLICHLADLLTKILAKADPNFNAENSILKLVRRTSKGQTSKSYLTLL